MKDTFKIYNNEAFICCIIQNLLSNIKRMDIGRLFILTAFLLQDKIITDRLIYTNPSIINYITSNPRKLTSFSRIFEELTPLILNSLTLLCETDDIKLDINNLVIVNHKFKKVSSQRLSQINIYIPLMISQIENVSSKQLYDTLKIKL